MNTFRIKKTEKIIRQRAGRVVKPTTAIILAAGKGGRLAPLTNEIPKCLLQIGKTTIIQFQIKKLEQVGINNIVIVTGYHEEKVRRTCGADFTYIYNKNFATTNSLYSLHLAREYAGKGCLVLNSDVIFHFDLIKKLLDSDFPDAIIVDFRENLGEEEMKVIASGSHLHKISKDISPPQAQGENLGIVKLSSKGAGLLMKIAEREFKNGNKNLWVPQGIDRMLPRYPFYVVPTNNLPWIEIDYVHDLERARKDIYPLCK